MKRARFPDSLVLIFLMIVAAFAATYLLDPGEFQREGRKVIAGTYTAIEAEPLPWYAVLTLIPKGFEGAAEIIFFVFMVGGVVGVLRASGAIDALLGTAIRRLGRRPLLLVGGMMTLFAVGSSTIGMAEEYMPFIPLLVAMCLALGLDAIVALGIVYFGAAIGYGCAALNPFTVMIAKDIAGLDPNSGVWLRWALLPVMLAVGIQHLWSYMRRLREDPSSSLVADVDYSAGYSMPKDVRLSAPRVAILLAFVALIGIFVWGVNAHGWFLVELQALFFGLALLAGLLARLSPNTMARRFCEGAAEMTTTALLIGFAKTIEVVLVEGQVIDTVVQGIAGGLNHFGSQLAAVGMLLVQSLCNFFVPSGSGQAYVTMPIMAPIADLTGVGRETAVLAYQFGDGFTNLIVPTNALLMGMLALGRIPYQRWVRFVFPFLIKVYIIAALVLMICAGREL